MEVIDGVFYAKAAAYTGAALAIGFGVFGPAIGQGMIAMKGCEVMGKNPESVNAVRNNMFLAMALVETGAIYAVLIAGALIYVGSQL